MNQLVISFSKTKTVHVTQKGNFHMFTKKTICALCLLSISFAAQTKDMKQTLATAAQTKDMKQTLVTTLRNKKTSLSDFRKATESLAFLLANKASKHLEKQNIIIETPITKTTGTKLKNDIILVPVLRAGLSLVSPFMHFFKDKETKVGFIGARRNEETAIASIYYQHLPQISEYDDVIILETMLATAGTASLAIDILKKAGAKENKIIFVAILASKEGIKVLSDKYPEVKIVIAETDPTLNDKKYIVPGLGDFGDRFYGTD
jgi:uracil phosphoribosyltransferase